MCILSVDMLVCEVEQPRASAHLMMDRLVVRRVLVKGVRSRLTPQGDFPEKFEGAGRRVLVMWLPCLLYLLFNLWAITVAGPRLVDMVRSTFLAVNVCIGLLLSDPELEFDDHISVLV